MAEETVRVRVDPGHEIEVPLKQLLSVGEVMDEFAAPVWHWAHCGCCIVVHDESNAHDGYVIGPDGGRDWVVT
jgi:hypothetical protein